MGFKLRDLRFNSQLYLSSAEREREREKYAPFSIWVLCLQYAKEILTTILWSAGHHWVQV
jgi:hypothetical protein